MNFCILNREEDGDLVLVDYIDYSVGKSVEKSLYLSAGTYIVIPGSLGGYLQKPKNLPQGIVKPDYFIKEIPQFGNVLNPIYKSIIRDIFKKIDISMERIVEPDEL